MAHQSDRSSLQGSQEKHAETLAHAETNTDAHPEKEAAGQDAVNGDYSGAAKKTDPAEIKLVRKLDRMIMVRSV